MKILATTALATLALAGAISGAVSGASASRQEPPAAAFALSDLAWLAGTWEGQSGKTEQEELWMAPKGGLMLGLHRDVAGKRASFEYLRIEARKDGSIHYLASPSGRAATAFQLTRSTDGEAVFENAEHDFPQRIRYAREGDVLRAEISDLEGTKKMGWEWRAR